MSVKSFQQIFLFLEIEKQQHKPTAGSVGTNSNASQFHNGCINFGFWNKSVADGDENMLDDKYVVWEGVWKELSKYII